jgi:hypothetical protein
VSVHVSVKSIIKQVLLHACRLGAGVQAAPAPGHAADDDGDEGRGARVRPPAVAEVRGYADEECVVTAPRCIYIQSFGLELATQRVRY